MKFVIRTVIALFNVFLILHSCENNESAVLATVGSVSISGDEFQRRFNFNSVFTSEVPLSSQKEQVLSSLLAEKLLTIYAPPESDSNEIRVAREQTWREIIIEELRLDSVERKIEISESELEREYDKSLRDIHIKYLAFNDSSEAWQFYKKATSPEGESFYVIARNYLNQMGHTTESIPERRIVWGNESADLENEVYDMADGQIRAPFFVYGQYYIIMRERAVQNVSATPQDFATRRMAMNEKLFRERTEKKYREFYSRQILPILGKISWQRIQPIYDDLFTEAHFDTKKESSQSLEHPLNKEIFLSRNTRYADLLNITAINFNDGKSMSVEKVLERLAFGPYVFDYSSARKFKKSFFNMIHLMAEHEVVFNKALDYGYAENPGVAQKMTGWDSYYSAVNKKYDLQKASEEKTQQEILDIFLIEKSGELDIKIYPAVLESIELQPVGLLVRKSHFANRLMAAPVHNFMGLPSWENYVKKLLLAAQS